jgi:hypothetical protein
MFFWAHGERPGSGHLHKLGPRQAKPILEGNNIELLGKQYYFVTVAV